jgi:hypothetical protein
MAVSVRRVSLRAMVGDIPGPQPARYPAWRSLLKAKL